MNTIIGADTAKLAGLQIDLLQKISDGQVSLDHLGWFNKLTMQERDQFCNGSYPIGESRIITIDRTQPFDSVKLLGQGWAIDEQDERSLAFAQVDLARVQLKHMLESGESHIGGEEKLKRLKKAGHIRLDVQVFQTLWENQVLIPESWKEKTNGNPTFIFFDTILRDSSGRRCVLFLCWADGQWNWGYHWLEDDWDVSSPSAVLASI
ncbi:MAG: hypothetical protein ISS83_02055 [Candidatus Pacebacteria bacterium]|nr:hypothetical protein [Candidatus Paceibacterota bacterium]